MSLTRWSFSCASLVLALCACQPPLEPGTGISYSPCSTVMLRPAADTTPAELQSIAAAITLWGEVGREVLTLSELAEAEQVPVQFREAPALFHGVYEPSSGVVFVNRVLVGEAREITVAHELGHALGLPHIAASVRSSVMNPGNLSVRPTPEDHAQLMSACPPLP